MTHNDVLKTDAPYAALGFGLMRLPDVKQTTQMTDMYMEAGFNYFDTAYVYGGSEEKLREALAKRYPRESFLAADKIPPWMTSGRASCDKLLNESLKRCGLDYFDFYYMWNVKRYGEYEKAISAGDQYEALLEAKDQGLIRHICLSSHLDAHESIKIIDDGKIEGILLNLNILNFPYIIEAAIRAKRKGIGVGIMSPLYGGQIPLNEEKFPFLNMHGLSPTGEALCFASGLWCVDYAYVGFRSNEEVDYACEIADKGIVVDENELSGIREVVGSGLDKACCGCTYCMSYYPKQIPIAEYMLYYNLKYVYGYSQEEFEKRLNFHKQWFMLAKRKADAKDCIKCGACEKECTQHIGVISRLEEIAEIEQRLNI